MINRILVLLILISFFSCNSKGSKGKNLYEMHCGNCHGRNGEGLKDLYPALRSNQNLITNRDFIPCIIKYGIDKSSPYRNEKYVLDMPSNIVLNETNIANIINYLQHEMLDIESGEFITPQIVKQRLETCQ